MNRFGHRLPGRHRLLLHRRRDDVRRERDVLRLDVVGTVRTALLHVEDVHAEALLLDAVVGVDRDGVVVVVTTIVDAVLDWCCLDVELLRRVVVDDACIVVKVGAAVVAADGRRRDCDGCRAISAARYRLVVLRLRFPSPLVGCEEAHRARSS